MGGDRAPGPDGFPLFFYTTFWGVIKDDLTGVFNDLYRGNLQIKRLNEALRVLIPKREGAQDISDFRPISLLNGVYKIITKVIANRMADIVKTIIDPS